MTADNLRVSRVLIVDGSAGNPKLLRSIFANVGVGSVLFATDTDRALEILCGTQIQAVFCDGKIGPLDPVEFAIAVRRSEEVRNYRVPIIVVADRAHRSDVEACRDAGITDFIVRPVTVESIRRKLLVALANPKPFIQSDAFCGPDRRRKRERRVMKAMTPNSGRERRKPRPARRSTDPKLQPKF
jgi:CheY-like chemotaxis protein